MLPPIERPGKIGIEPQQILYRDETGSGRSASVKLEGAKSASMATGARKREFSMDASDIVAIGVVVLAVGAVFVAIIVALGLVFGRVPDYLAAKVILGCVGGSVVAGVAAVLVGRKKEARG